MNHAAAPIIRIATELLEREELDCIVLEEGVAIKTAMQLDDALAWTCNIEVAELSEEMYALGVFSRALIDVPPARLTELLFLLNGINAQMMTLGSFELDPDTLELTLRTAVLFESPDELSPQTIGHTLFMNWAEMEQHLPEIAEFLQGDEPASSCLARLLDQED